MRESIRAIDARGLGECQRVYGISRNVVARLARFNGIPGTSLYPPTMLTGLTPGQGDGGFLLSVARLDAAKRLDLVLRAVAATQEAVELRVASDGPERERLAQLAASLGIAERVRFLGRVTDRAVVDLYNSCRAVVYVPVDEDYGYAAVEALTAGKPVLTASDSGGVREFVRDGENGAVVEPDAGALAAVLDRWWKKPNEAARLGMAGMRAVADIGWPTVIRELTR